MRGLQALTSFCLVLFALPGLSVASLGDRSPDFRACVERCEQEKCLSSDGPSTLPLALRITRWTCTDDCHYTCMHIVTDHALAANEQVQQYYGKWPFRRFAGMQEPASVLFSLLNLWGHIKGFRSAKHVIPKSHPMRSYYLGWGLVNINAWIWSAVFHTRGEPVHILV